MKVYLVNPFYRMIYGKMSEVHCYDPPLGLPYLAAVLLVKGYNVVYRDAEVEFSGCDELREDLRRERPDVVGISCTTPLASGAKRIAETAKGLNPRVMTVAGGCHPSALPGDLLAPGLIDACVIGEGEETLPDLLASFARGERAPSCHGIAFLRDGEVVRTPPRPLVADLDSIPYPARHLMRMEKYTPALVTSLSTRNNYASIITTRGCPYPCVYCGSGAIFGKRIRYRSARNVIGEIEECVTKYNVGYVGFVDDTFACKKQHAMDICAGIRKAGLDIQWAAQMRVDNVDEELLATMKETGCTEIHFGYESGSPEVLKRIRKGITPEQSLRATRMAQRVGLDIHGYFMLGNPGETPQTVRETIRLARKLNPDTVQFTIAQPFPGTELYEIAKKEGQISDDFSDYRWYGSIKYLPPGITREQLLKLYRKAYWAFYLRPGFVLKMLRKKGIAAQWRWYLSAMRAFIRIVFARGTPQGDGE